MSGEAKIFCDVRQCEEEKDMVSFVSSNFGASPEEEKGGVAAYNINPR